MRVAFGLDRGVAERLPAGLRGGGVDRRRFLAEEAAVGEDEALAAGRGAAGVDHRSDGVHRIIIARAAEEGEAAGEGERGGVGARVYAEGFGGEQDGDGEAAVEVHHRDIGRADAAGVQRLFQHRHGSEAAREVGSFARRAVFGVGMAVEEDVLVCGDAEPVGFADAGQDHRCALIDRILRDIPFEIWVSDGVVFGAGGKKEFGAALGGELGIGIARGDRGETGPERGHQRAMTVFAEAKTRCECVFERGIGLRRCAEAVGDLIFREEGRAEAEVLVVAVRTVAPVELDARLERRLHRRRRFAAREQDGAAFARMDRSGAFIDQRLRLIPADLRINGIARV